MVLIKGPTRQQFRNGTYKLIHGRFYKKCTGPAHAEDEDGCVYLPATEKYFYLRKNNPNEKATLSPRCRLCTNWDKLKNPGSHHGYVSIAKAYPVYLEAVNRIGIMELAKRTGVSRGSINGVLTHRTKKVQKAKLRAVMLELVSIKRKGEFAQTKQLKVWNDHRLNGSSGTCAGCGGSLDNVTDSCPQCYDRFRNRHRDGKISDQEWESIKLSHFGSQRNLILGILHE